MANFCCIEKVAIKLLDKLKLDNKTQRLLSREISIMENLNHPNIVRIYEVIETISKLHIVLECCPCVSFRFIEHPFPGIILDKDDFSLPIYPFPN